MNQAPDLAVGEALPSVPWTIDQHDRIYNVLIAGGQGSGKSSLLLRLAINDILAPNTATVVLDMKGSLSERLLRLVPPDIPKQYFQTEGESLRSGSKRLWHLDLRRPSFGLTPLRVEPGWSHTGLADEFARIADAVTRALLDLYPGQIMGSSEDLIERAVIGTMAIAWWEHERDAAAAGRDPTVDGFSGSFEVLAQMFAPSDRYEDNGGSGRRVVQPNRWHQAAGRACQSLPNLDQVAETLLFEIPRQARDNLADIAKRMEAPANKLRPLVGAAASVRRFVGHPERLSLRSVIEAHDTLIVNPRIELIGEDQASILTNFIVHMLDLQLKRQTPMPKAQRPRVSLIIDEAHRLVTDTLVTMAATHREAGLTLAAAVQYVSQLGADAPTPARRERILKGVGNLLQSKVLFRMSDSDDASEHTQIFRSVYESVVRADPTSRVRMPFDPAQLQTLRDHHALVSLVCSSEAGQGASRLPAFVTKTYAMPEVEDIPSAWRDLHLSRQAEIFTEYPEDMTVLAPRGLPEGLDARGSEGRVRTTAHSSAGPGARTLIPGPPSEAASPAAEEQAGEAAVEVVGGVRIERTRTSQRATLDLGRSPSSELLCQPTTRTLPSSPLVPVTSAARAALSEAAALDGADSVGRWDLVGDDARACARRAAERAREKAVAEAHATGIAPEQAEAIAIRHAQRAAAKALAPHAKAAWRTPVEEVRVGVGDAETLATIARVGFTAPRHLTALLVDRPSERALRERLARLFESELVARADISIPGRRGRRPRLYAAAPRGLEYLRTHHEADGQSDPRHLRAGRDLPSAIDAQQLRRELAAQLFAIALEQFQRGSQSQGCHWTRGRRWEIGMIRSNGGDHQLTLSDLVWDSTVHVHGERLGAHRALEPDLSIELRGELRFSSASADMFVEIDPGEAKRRVVARMAAYDAFLGGWFMKTRRFAVRGRPIVVFATTQPERILELMKLADETLTLGYAAKGEYSAAAFAYPSRRHVVFCCLDWILGGQALGLRLPALPPAARAAGESLRPETVALLPEDWWPTTGNA